MSLIFFIVSVVASRAHRVFRHVIRHSSTQRICAHARGSEVNAAKDARIGDFRHRVRETRKRTSARTHIRGDAKRCVLSKRGGEDERRRTTHCGMTRRILGMRWSASRKEVQPWHPSWIRVCGRETVPDCGYRPPENVPVFAIPARDGRVGHGHIQQRK